MWKQFACSLKETGSLNEEEYSFSFNIGKNKKIKGEKTHAEYNLVFQMTENK